MVEKMRRLLLLLCTLFLLAPASLVHASISDQLYIKIGDSDINIMWFCFEIEEFYDLKNLYPIIALAANNYKAILQENKQVMIRCFENGGTYTINDYSTDEYLTYHYGGFDDLQKGLIDIIANYFKLNKDIPDSFSIIRLDIPGDEIVYDSDHQYYHNYSQLYYGAAPGSMQVIIDGTLYYQYFFFESNPIAYILDQKEAFRGIIEKRQINRDNIEQVITPYYLDI